MATEKLVGAGIEALQSRQSATGTIRFLDSPDEVLAFVVTSTQFTDGVQTSRSETVPADGTTVRLDVAGDRVQVFLVED